MVNNNSVNNSQQELGQTTKGPKKKISKKSHPMHQFQQELFFLPNVKQPASEKKEETPVASTSEKKRKRKTDFLSREIIAKYIHYSQSEAAKKLGVSVSSLKRRFYELGMGIRWPNLNNIKECHVDVSSVLKSTNTSESTSSSSSSSSASTSSSAIETIDEDGENTGKDGQQVHPTVITSSHTLAHDAYLTVSPPNFYGVKANPLPEHNSAHSLPAPSAGSEILRTSPLMSPRVIEDISSQSGTANSDLDASNSIDSPSQQRIRPKGTALLLHNLVAEEEDGSGSNSNDSTTQHPFAKETAPLSTIHKPVSFRHNVHPSSLISKTTPHTLPPMYIPDSIPLVPPYYSNYYHTHYFSQPAPAESTVFHPSHAYSSAPQYPPHDTYHAAPHSYHMYSSPDHPSYTPTPYHQQQPAQTRPTPLPPINHVYSQRTSRTSTTSHQTTQHR